MPDVHTPEQRHRNMAAIKCRDTKPEMIVRRVVHGMGFRYRLHDPTLPGKPDLTFHRLEKAIFVHGCFWHMHDCENGQVKPQVNSAFWRRKRSSNVLRDTLNEQLLRILGWHVLVIWECQVGNTKVLSRRIRRFLS